MQSQIYYLASLSVIDQKRDELDEEYGDLPDKLSELQERVRECSDIVAETENILSEVRNFASSSKVTLVELKDKEEKLAKQQFLVRNNKEFDAITKEIEHSRQEYSRISDELRNVGVKEENLLNMLESQKKDVEAAKAEFDEINSELEHITSNQNEELKELIKIRENLVKSIEKVNFTEYKRIRTLHKDSVVKIRKNSCSGCYSQVPPQKIVEIRNNLETLHYCEHCGRIIFPEEVELDKSILNL